MPNTNLKVSGGAPRDIFIDPSTEEESYFKMVDKAREEADCGFPHAHEPPIP